MDTTNPTPVVDPPANVATGSPSSTLWVAMVRSAWSAISAALLAGLLAYQQMPGTMSDEDAIKKALIVALAAFLAPVGVRGVVEGAWDANRQKTGNAAPSDVTPTPVP